MAGELIRLDNKHISVDQMTMSVDRVLQCYIRNMFGLSLPLIENYLRECTITLEDVHLQLGLPVDGHAVTGSTSSTDWGAICYELLGVILDKINGGQIEMGWLRDTFPEPDNDSTELERIRYARAYILEMIGGYLMPDLSRNLGDATEQSQNRRLPITTTIMGTFSLSIFTSSSRPPICIFAHNENHSASYVGIPTSFEDIRLLLDQRSEAEFQWTPYKDPAIRAVIPDEFFQNPNVWHILVAPEVFDDEHKVDLQQLHTDWPRFWSHYIKIWENRYDYIPTREPIIVPELACVAEYMPWFRIHGKLYLLSEDKRRRQIRAQRKRQGPLNPRRRDDDAGPSTTPTQSSGPIVQQTTPTSQPF
ncbi:hypothetical protein CXB51_035334 [Gossypium anomalum]|uniref:Aminotransferase-like plant mobile domain-containing protein n=1 Tax=Gossypium anomalum TaxID=47600 RepID=A0A8J5XX91_9ROSI|nr:hypothetical protein CXB51_035334 [Gossypium anomalum]